MDDGWAQRRLAKDRRNKRRGKGVSQTFRVWTRAQRDEERRRRGLSDGT